MAMTTELAQKVEIKDSSVFHADVSGHPPVEINDAFSAQERDGNRLVEVVEVVVDYLAQEVLRHLVSEDV